MTTAAAPMTPAAIAVAIGDAWSSYLTNSARGLTPHDSVYASSWRECDRRMVLDLLCPDTLPPPSAELLARFRRGDDRERDLLADLVRVGRDAAPPFSVIGQQERFVLKDRRGRPAIVGKVDARLDLRQRHRPPVEIKTWSPNLVDRIDTFADLFEQPWTRSGGYQLLSYLYGAAEPYGFLLLDRSGVPKLIPVELDANLDRMEAFLTKAERVLDHLAAYRAADLRVADDTLPPYLEDAAECRRCPWYGWRCNPPLSPAGTTRILTDPALEAALERRETLKAAAKEFGDLDDEIKGALRGVERAIAGRFVITGTWGKQSKLDVPEAIRKQYTVSNPKGRFTLDITPL